MAVKYCDDIKTALADLLFQQRERGFVHNSLDAEMFPFSLMKQGLTRAMYLSSGAQIFVDDEVLTSGRGGTFPPRLLIGTVTNVLTESGGQVTYGIVTPACDVSRLSQVFIIKDFAVVE